MLKFNNISNVITGPSFIWFYHFAIKSDSDLVEVEFKHPLQFLRNGIPTNIVSH